MNKDAWIVKLVESYLRDATRAAEGPKDFRLISSAREDFYRMLARKKLYIDKLKLSSDVRKRLLPLLRGNAGDDVGQAGSSGAPLEFNDTLDVVPKSKKTKTSSLSIDLKKPGKGRVETPDTPSTSQKPAYTLRPRKL